MWRIRLFPNEAVLVFLLVAVGGTSLVASSDRQHQSEASRLRKTPEGRAIQAALSYLPGARDWTVQVIDPEFAANPTALRALDAFIVREETGLRRKVYLNRESTILQEAAKGVDFYVKVLAAVLVHEAEHLRGESESVARRAEREFFQNLVARGLVQTQDGLRYLALLRQKSADRH